MCLLSALGLIKTWLASIVTEQSIAVPGMPYVELAKVTNGVLAIEGVGVQISLRAIAAFLSVLAFLFARSLLRSPDDFPPRRCDRCDETDCRRMTCRIRARLKPHRPQQTPVIPMESPWTWDRLN